MKRAVVLGSVILIWVLAGPSGSEMPPVDRTVYELQRACANGIAARDSVIVRDVVITGIDVRPTTYGFWVQELPGSDPLYPYYSGILCYTGTAFPTGLYRGDKMTVTGVYAEYPPTSCADTAISLSEIDSYYPWLWVKTGTAPLPDPVLLSAYDVGVLSSDAPRAEKWEGVLVRLDTVVCTSYDPTFPDSRWWVKEAHNHPPSTTNDSVYIRMDKLPDPYPGRPNIGDTLVSLTGIHHWEMGRYQICSMARDIAGTVEKELVPTEFSVSQSYPNPFNPVCTIEYDIARSGTASLRVFDVSGSVVRTLFEAPREPGVYRVVWDGRDDAGRMLPSGVYFYRLEAGEFVATKKIVLLK